MLQETRSPCCSGEPIGRVSETEEEFAERNADDPLALFRFRNVTESLSRGAREALTVTF